MIGTNRVVTQAKKQATNRLPDFLSEGAVLVESLELPDDVADDDDAGDAEDP